MIVVDTNVLIDLREEDATWRDWSYRTVAELRVDCELVLSVVSIGELAARRGRLDELLDLCGQLDLRVTPFSAAAAYRAGVAQRGYREAGGRGEKLLADFMIGGEAGALDASLLTRDPRPYRRYFPDLPLITPETHP